jgi:hypothetical protein
VLQLAEDWLREEHPSLLREQPCAHAGHVDRRSAGRRAFESCVIPPRAEPGPAARTPVLYTHHTSRTCQSVPVYRRPDVAPIELHLPPVLESWNSHDHPDQVRLRTFLDHLEQSLTPFARENLVLDLRVGLPKWKSLVSGGGDLDNFLFPIARRIGAARFDAVFGSKEHRDVSTVAIDVAEPLPAFRDPDMRVRTTTSASTKAWKEQVRDACAGASPSTRPAGPLSVDIEFRLSPARNWTSIWKPAIDSLGPLLGVRNPNRPFTPDDDRIVALGLHRVLDESLGWDVDLSVWWTRSAA